MARRHEQRAEVGVADAELPVSAGRLGDLGRGEVCEADGDVHRRDHQFGNPLEPLYVERVFRAQELEQVDAGEVARRVVEVDVFTAISYHGATNNVGTVTWLGQVEGEFVALRLA